MKINESLRLIRQGARFWNAWRKDNPSLFPILDGIELIDMDLDGIDFSGLSLQGAIINRCKLRAAVLISSNFSHANLQANDLSRAKMIAAKLTNADLSDCNLGDANILTASVRGACLDRIDFRGHDLCGLDLRNTSLSHCNLDGQSLAGADLSEVNLSHCVFNSVDLSRANLANADLYKADFRGAQLLHTSFRQANLEGANFAKKRIENIGFEDANLVNADFRETNIQSCNFSRAEISGVLLWKMQAKGWNLARIKCGFAFWDKDGKEKTYYSKHEFESIYAESITVDLRYPFRLSANEIATLPIFIEHLQASHWGTVVRLKTVQDVAGGALVTLAVDETGRYHPSELKDALQNEANRIQMAQVALRRDAKLQQALKEEVASIKENFWPRLLELAADNEREQVRNLTIVFMDLKGFSSWKDDEMSEKLSLFRGLVKPILERWRAGYPNMEGDSLRVTFRNATAGLACACMMRDVLVAAGFELRIGIELGEVTVVHNEVTDLSDLEGSAVIMAARLEECAEAGEVLVTEKVRHYTNSNEAFDFVLKKAELKKSMGDKKRGDNVYCYAINMLKPAYEIC